ncbi:hypothetical protein [Streptomyces vinaceus]|uniref:hypothetical protein n=1 Tax=Streptomyces vinaceus TaxID=1960 RepID=UPI003806B9AC
MTDLALVLLTIAVIVMFALLSAAAAGVLARFDGASYPGALLRAGATFVAVIGLAAASAAALSAR